MPENLLIETADRITTITLNRPKALNALNAQTMRELTTALQELPSDTHAVIFTGAGEKAFVAGADITEMAGLGPNQARAFSALGFQLGEAFANVHAVTIAAVNGFALGGGLELALCCDLIYASENAKLGVPEVTLGVIPGFGGTQRLSRLIGPMLAREMVFTGDMYDAQTAKARGLVCDVLPKEKLLEHVRGVATKISSRGPIAVANAKQVMRLGQDIPLYHANLLEQQAFGLLFDTADQKEGMAAFVEKRPAQFKGA